MKLRYLYLAIGVLCIASDIQDTTERNISAHHHGITRSPLLTDAFSEFLFGKFPLKEANRIKRAPHIVLLF